MLVKLTIRTGAASGRTLELIPGKVGMVGRASWAELHVPDDTGISGRHFVLECHPRHCRLRDLKSTNGTLVNGELVPEALLNHGDTIVAGQTQFEVWIEEEGDVIAVSASEAAPPPSVGKTQEVRVAAFAAMRAPVPPAPPVVEQVCVVLEVISGPGVGRRHVVKPGQVALVGRASWAEVSVPGDSSLSGRHFSLTFDAGSCRMRDLQSKNGTRVNGKPANEAVLTHGDHVMAGESIFRVLLDNGAALPLSTQAEIVMPPERVEPATPASVRGLSRRSAAPVVPETPLGQVHRILRETSEPVFALLDAARDQTILPLLQESGVVFRSLYEGPQGESLARWAPYLVEFPAKSAFLERLLTLGWGKSWGVFFNSKAEFLDVRKHFRHFLLCKLPDGREVYFRYYDPRVLRVFLPTATPEQMKEFFGPVSRFVMEDKLQETLLHFTLSDGKLREKLVPLWAGAVPA